MCNYFSINHIDYLGLSDLPEDTIQDKLIKIRALLGAKSWSDVANYLGYSQGFVIDLLTRYAPKANHINKINLILASFKQNYRS